MRAAVVEKVGLLTVRDVAKPHMGEYDALCEILYGATCGGTDLHLIAGKHPRPVQYPTVLGHESVGRVIRVGSKVENFHIGDLITRVGCPASDKDGYYSNWGGFAEYGIAKDHVCMKRDGLPETLWKKSCVNMVIPPDIAPDCATMIITWRETYSYIKRLIADKERRSILILGSGSNALAFAVHARNLGFQQICVIGSSVRREVFMQASGAQIYDYKDPAYLEKIRAYAEKDGFGVILDAIGKDGMLDSVMECLAANGTIGVYGWEDFFSNKIRPIAARGSFYVYNGGYDENEAHDDVVRLVQAGKLNAGYWIDCDHPFSLERICDAYERVKDRTLLKALIKIK